VLIHLKTKDKSKVCLQTVSLYLGNALFLDSTLEKVNTDFRCILATRYLWIQQCNFCFGDFYPALSTSRRDKTRVTRDFNASANISRDRREVSFCTSLQEASNKRTDSNVSSQHRRQGVHTACLLLYDPRDTLQGCPE
jgi:hypothetical protein